MNVFIYVWRVTKVVEERERGGFGVNACESEEVRVFVWGKKGVGKMGRKGKMELQMEDEEAATGGGETEPTASFEIDLDDSNINVGKKKGSRGAPSSRASGGVAPPMSPDMPSVSPQMSTRTKVPRGMHCIHLSVYARHDSIYS